MKILILSFYYYPDLCPGSFRCKALVDQLQQMVKNNYEIEVITTAPNRYATFKVDAPDLEKYPNVTIRRIRLPAHCSGMVDQAKAFAHFAKEANKLVKNKDYCLVFATSSRLMTAWLGAFIAWKKRAKLYLDIRDIFTDTLSDILPSKASLVAKPFFSLLEKWAFTRAHRINLISKGFKNHMAGRYPKAHWSWFPNGIDPEFQAMDEETEANAFTKPLVVLYAGNIGEGQGLHRIVPLLAKRMGGKIKFKLIGDGGRKARLESEVILNQCSNIEILPPVNRKQLIKEYQQADILFLHLNDYEAFSKVLPSKIFEYAATKKPIWAGVVGYSAEFITAEVDNAAVFNPCDVDGAEQAFNKLKLANTARKDFVEKYQRHNIMQSMAADMLSLLE